MIAEVGSAVKSYKTASSVRSWSIELFAPAKIWLTFLFIAFQTILGSKAFGAEVEIVSSPHCQIRISGQITEGDTFVLRQATEILVREGVWRYGDLSSTRERRVCLDSPGGSLLEAARLAEFLFDQSIGTVLDARAVCLSACAWVFMLGYEFGEEGEYHIPNRRMHYTARLGFHAPRLEFSRDSAFSSDEMIRAQAVLNAAVARILEISSSRQLGRRPAIDVDLLTNAFAAGSRDDDYFNIESVDHAGRWQIEVFGMGWPTRIGHTEAFWACTNLTQWPVATVGPFGIERARGALQLHGQVTTRTTEALIEVTGPDDGMLGHRCVVDLNLEDNHVRICGFNGNNEVDLGKYFDPCISTTTQLGTRSTLYRHPAIAIFPPNLPVSEIADAAASVADQEGGRLEIPRNDFRSAAMDPAQVALSNAWLAETLATGRAVDSDDVLHRACVPSSETLQVVRVYEFATLRDRPSFDASVLSQLPRGTQVTVRGQATVADNSDSRRACAAACLSAGTNRDREQQAVRRCYLENELWFPVRHNGQSGFVGGRYLGAVLVEQQR